MFDPDPCQQYRKHSFQYNDKSCGNSNGTDTEGNGVYGIKPQTTDCVQCSSERTHSLRLFNASRHSATQYLFVWTRDTRELIQTLIRYLITGNFAKTQTCKDILIHQLI